MIKLVVFDIDKTLAGTNEAMKISTIELLRELENKGVTVAIASGKPISYVSGFVRQIELKNPILIGENGYHIHFGDEFPPKKHFRLPVDENKVKLLKEIKKKIVKQPFYEDAWLQPNDINIACMHDTVKTEREVETFLIEELKNERYQDLHLTKYFDCMEVAIEGISKGLAVEKVMKELNLKSSEVITTGDGINDLSMFKVSGTAFGIKLKPEYTSRVNINFTNIDEVIRHIFDLIKQ
jgi:HAD superfamily hydrolase (TIGR01484 family)